MANDPDALTIGALAAAADVGVETVRYYQRRKLLPVPQAASGYRRYDADVLARLRFIRRAQSLGFTLEEIAELLQLQDGADRRSVRRIAQARLDQLRSRIDDMQKMARTLQHLIHECEHAARAPRCPIIASIESPPRRSTETA
jgi:MerR family mercuric resistance operon transcriptional regulator